MSVELRDLAPGDADACAAVHVASWRAAYRGIVDAALLDADDLLDRRRDRWREIAAAPVPDPGAGPRTLVAVLEGRVVGFATWGPPVDHSGADPEARRAGRPPAGGGDPGAGEVWALYVHPDHWGGGMGRALLGACRDRLAAVGRGDVRLWVLADNTAARGFYRRQGFEATGRAAPIDLGPGGRPLEVELAWAGADPRED